jgi:hypothetical protein
MEYVLISYLLPGWPEHKRMKDEGRLKKARSGNFGLKKVP